MVFLCKITQNWKPALLPSIWHFYEQNESWVQLVSYWPECHCIISTKSSLLLISLFILLLVIIIKIIFISWYISLLYIPFCVCVFFFKCSYISFLLSDVCFHIWFLYTSNFVKMPVAAPLGAHEYMNHPKRM